MDFIIAAEPLSPVPSNADFVPPDPVPLPVVPHAESVVSAAISAEPIAILITGFLCEDKGLELRLEIMFG
jgi:hypothetical protein